MDLDLGVGRSSGGGDEVVRDSVRYNISVLQRQLDGDFLDG